MKIWSISFILLFGSVELYQWFRAMHIPLFVYLGLGVFLAIASNAEKSFLRGNSASLLTSDSSEKPPEPMPRVIPKPPQTRDSISFKIKH